MRPTIFLLLALLATLVPAPSGSAATLPVEDFEDGPSGWTTTGAGWQWGTPVGGADSGTSAWGASLDPASTPRETVATLRSPVLYFQNSGWLTFRLGAWTSWYTGPYSSGECSKLDWEVRTESGQRLNADSLLASYGWTTSKVTSLYAGHRIVIELTFTTRATYTDWMGVVRACTDSPRAVVDTVRLQVTSHPDTACPLATTSACLEVVLVQKVAAVSASDRGTPLFVAQAGTLRIDAAGTYAEQTAAIVGVGADPDPAIYTVDAGLARTSFVPGGLRIPLVEASDGHGSHQVWSVRFQIYAGGSKVSDLPGYVLLPM